MLVLFLWWLQEYARSFSKLREYLSEFSSKYPHPDNPANAIADFSNSGMSWAMSSPIAKKSISSNNTSNTSSSSSSSSAAAATKDVSIELDDGTGSTSMSPEGMSRLT